VRWGEGPAGGSAAGAVVGWGWIGLIFIVLGMFIGVIRLSPDQVVGAKLLQLSTAFAAIGATLARLFQRKSAPKNPTCIIAHGDVFRMPGRAK
jgi:hypothetical protein